MALTPYSSSISRISTPEGTLTVSTKSDERELDVSLSGSDMEGAFGSYSVLGARDIFGKKTYLDRTKAKAAVDNWKGNYVVALKADSDESSLGNGYVGLSVQVRANGRTRVSGTMPDGTRVSYSGRMAVFDDHCLLPVVVPLYSGKRGGFGFLMAFSDEGVSASVASQWINTVVPFVSELEVEGAGMAEGISQSATFSLENSFDDIAAADDLLPSDVEVSVSGSIVNIPVRSIPNNPNFDFYSQSTETRPKNDDADANISTSSAEPEEYYVSMFAVAVGQDNTYARLYSNVLYLGSVKISKR